MRVAMAVLCFVASGCASGPSRQQEQWDQEKLEFVKLGYDIKCPGEYGRPCGLLSYLPENSADTYRKEFCKKPDRTCLEGYLNMMNSKYLLRYRFANTDEVLLQCNADPRACTDTRNMELWMLQSHNQKVHDKAMMRLQELNAQAADESQSNRSAIGSAMQTFGDSMKSNSINCTTIGNNTTCR